MRKALFLDRDGVINKMVTKYSKSYGRVMEDTPFNISELRFNEGIEELLRFAERMGYFPVIVTNQPSLVKENILLKDYEEVTKEICTRLGLRRAQVFECFHKEGFTLECDCRKPKPGLFLMAKGMFDLDLENSVMIGDSYTDIQAAQNAGVKKTIYLRRDPENEKEMKAKGIYPSESVNTLSEVIQNGLL